MRKLLFTICTLLASCLIFSGCLGGGSSQSEENVLAAPTSLKMNSKGVLSWDEVENATTYEISIGDATNTTDDVKQDLTELITDEGSYTISVKAKNETTSSETATYSLTAVKLPTPSTPVIESDPVTHMVKFVWTGGENTRGYLQQINDGKWVSNTETYYSISSTGTYTISVKAKSYAANDVLYLESDASEKSATCEYQQGPVLSLDGMSLISWASDTEFDSYNLWVNGEKVKEGVESGETGYNLVLGDAPALTKTGEYNLQIEAIKDGNSYWSNVLEEVGTYNINPNEIYSFDNRKANFTVIKEGVSISDEHYHGESGYSLRFDAQHAEQLNFTSYVAKGHANDIKYLTIKKISYWVYVEPIEGYEGDFPASDLPSIKWEKRWKKINSEGKEVDTYKGCMFSATENVPFGEWVKVEIDNIEMAYNGILIMSFAKVLEPNYVMYIDDICFEECYEEINVSDAEYSVSYTAAPNYQGSWTGYKFTELDFGVENANKTISVSMSVCGNADATLGTKKLGFFNTFVPDRDAIDGEWQFIYIDADKISNLDTWNKIIVQMQTNQEGKCYITGLRAFDESIAPYSIFLKDVSIIDMSQVDGTAMPAGEQKTSDANGYYQAAVGLSTDLAVGTAVTVEMDVYITGSFDQYTQGILWIDSVWTAAGGEVNKNTNILNYTTMNASAGQWIKLSFDATVRDFKVLRMGTEFATIDVSKAGKAVFIMAANFTSAESFNYKNVTITAKDVEPDTPVDPEQPVIDGTAMPAGTQKTSGANGYYQAAVGLSTNLAVGTAVTVEMDVYITGSFDQYTQGILWIDSVWTAAGGEVNKNTNILNYTTMNASAGQWIKLSFDATVRDFKVLRMGTEFATIDVSKAGNAVFIMAANFKSAESFNYKNVTITAKAAD